MDPYGETGQSTIEWLALMAMLVALAGVLVATVPSIGDTIVGAFEKLINSVAG
jgi:Flp pilus assembly pilin Flp